MKIDFYEKEERLFAFKTKKERDELKAQIGRMENAKRIKDSTERVAKRNAASVGLVKLLKGNLAAAIICAFERKRLRSNAEATPPNK